MLFINITLPLLWCFFIHLYFSEYALSTKLNETLPLLPPRSGYQVSHSDPSVIFCRIE